MAQQLARDAVDRLRERFYAAHPRCAPSGTLLP
jgi:hypothetical protein